MRDDSDGSGLLCSGSYAMIPLQVRGLLYLGFEQLGNKKRLEILPPVLTSLLQSQALNQEIPSLQLHSRERAVAGCCFMHCRRSGDCMWCVRLPSTPAGTPES